MYSKTTHDIKITAHPVFLDHQSDPASDSYMWAYHIDIENQGPEPVQLHWRQWSIIDGAGNTENISGEGVIGETPVIAAGAKFGYTSGLPLKTPSGIMTGQYVMQNEAGDNFMVDIPAFSLDSPYQSATYH